jgi:hypothetical protein
MFWPITADYEPPLDRHRRSFVDIFNSLLTVISCSATQVAYFASLARLINNQVASVKHELKVTCKHKFVF